MFGIKIPGTTDPKATMIGLMDKAQSESGLTINHLIMEVDFKSEEFVFKMPEHKRLERVNNAFLFMAINAAIQMEFGEELNESEILALVVDTKRDGPMESTCYYLKNGDKLKTTKTT